MKTRPAGAGENRTGSCLRTDQLVGNGWGMTTIGLFEAKTKLSELCERVARRREPLIITRRGRPLVRIEPVSPGKGMSSSVWDSRDAWEKKHGGWRENLALPARARQKWRNPLED